jgi:hypothetical protein
MAVINLENIAATASITIQLIKDYSMYESEIISSNGTIFQSTDTDTTLTLRIFKGVEDITNKITDIEWSKFYFDREELKEDVGWRDGKQNEKRIVLDKDDIEGKSIIQASCYSMIEGNRELVSTARLTFIKISDVYVSDVTPSGPSDKMMWMDTKVSPPVLKIWDETKKIWVSSGTETPIVKNHIKNSNFWTDIDGYYDIVNSNTVGTPTIISYKNKRWVSMQSRNLLGASGGLEQEIQYPVLPNSSYMFNCIAYKDSDAYYSGNKLKVTITSINDRDEETEVENESITLNNEITSVSVPFKTLNDTMKLKVYIGTQNNRRCWFYVTELSLYNSAVYYPWEPCPDDVNNQMNVKLDNDRASVFNTLTDNNSYKAIYESGNQYYIRAEYITPAVAAKDDFDELEKTVTQLSNTHATDKTNINKNITDLQSQITTLSNTHSTDKTNINKSITNLQNSYSALNNDYAAHKQSNATSIQNLKDKDTALQNLINTLSSTHSADISALDNSIQNFKNTHSTDIKALQDTIKGLQNTVTALQGTVTALQNRVTALEGENKTPPTN